MLGIFMMPTLTYACETKAEKSCCKKESTTKTEKAACCKKDNPSKDKKEDGCGGKCTHTSCNCPVSHCSLTLVLLDEIKPKSFYFENEKQKFHDVETFLSSGFHSLWLIPKIS